MNKKKIYDVVFKNKVVVLFIFLCVGATIASKQPLTFIIPELFTRISRNTFTVLSLLIPVMAGMGMNFGIVIGAMAAQIAIFLTSYWGLVGISGFLITVVVATPFAIFFGYLVGKLFNHMKGAEMIGGLVLSYFADGLYQLLFLFIFGGVITLNNPKLMISTGVGVKNTIDLKDTVKYALDTVPMLTIIEFAFYIFLIVVVLSTIIKLVKKIEINWKSTGIKVIGAVLIYLLTFVPMIEQFLAKDRLLLLTAIELLCAGTLLFQLGQFLYAKFVAKKAFNGKKALVNCAIVAIVYALTYVPALYAALLVVQLPVLTYLCIAGLCVFNNILMKTRLGQNMRTVGNNRAVATAAGINVDKTRIIAMIFSTVLASWGQLIFLQNIGTFATYGAHTQVGTFAIAALLVGGASIQKANYKQAILGIVLFHTLFIVAPLAGKELFGDPAIGEYFRVFVSYGVIAMSLAMHAWKKPVKEKVEGEKKPDAAQTA